MKNRGKDKNKKGSSKPSIDARLTRIEKQQKEIIALLKETTAKEDAEEKLGLEELKEEKQILSEEKQEMGELKKIEELEQTIKDELKEHPLKRITYQDVTKGIIGAFFGIVGHFSFAEGVQVAKHHSILQSITLLITSFFIIIGFIYFAGFRKVRDKFFLKIMPVRAIVIYFSALFTIIIVLFIYGEISITTPASEIFSNVAAISVLAVLGAGTADLLGNKHE